MSETKRAILLTSWERAVLRSTIKNLLQADGKGVVQKTLRRIHRKLGS